LDFEQTYPGYDIETLVCSHPDVRVVVPGRVKQSFEGDAQHFCELSSVPQTRSANRVGHHHAMLHFLFFPATTKLKNLLFPEIQAFMLIK